MGEKRSFNLADIKSTEELASRLEALRHTKEQRERSVEEELAILGRDLQQHAPELIKDETFLGWVRSTFKDAVLIIAVLKTMTGVSTASTVDVSTSGKTSASEVKPAGATDNGSIDLEESLGISSDHSGKKDTGNFDLSRGFSPNYEVGRGQLDFGQEEGRLDNFVKSFCAQHNIQPWEVGMDVSMVSSSSVEGDAQKNYSLAGKGLAVVEKWFAGHLPQLGVDESKIKIITKNLGETSKVDGKVLDESGTKTEIARKLAIDVAKVDKLIHAYNHKGKLSSEQSAVLGEYIGDSRGVEIKITLSDLSNKVESGTTEYIPAGAVLVNEKLILKAPGEDEPAIPNNIPVIPDRQQTSGELYNPKSLIGRLRRLFRKKIDLSPAVPEPPQSKEESTPKTAEIVLTFPDVPEKLPVLNKPETPAVTPARPAIPKLPDVRPASIPRGDLPPVIRPPKREISPKVEKVVITDPEDDEVVESTFQKNPNVQGTRRLGSVGRYRKLGKEGLKIGNDGHAIDLPKVANKGIKPKTYREEEFREREENKRRRTLYNKTDRGRKRVESTPTEENIQEE